MIGGLPGRSSRPQPAFALWASAWQPSLASRAKAGGGRRTRTFEVVRRLIYSQLPLPLGTLPRPNSVTKPSAQGGGGQDHQYGAEPAAPGNGARSGAFMGKRAKPPPSGAKLPETGTHDRRVA